MKLYILICIATLFCLALAPLYGMRRTSQQLGTGMVLGQFNTMLREIDLHDAKNIRLINDKIRAMRGRNGALASAMENLYRDAFNALRKKEVTEEQKSPAKVPESSIELTIHAEPPTKAPERSTTHTAHPEPSTKKPKSLTVPAIHTEQSAKRPEAAIATAAHPADIASTKLLAPAKAPEKEAKSASIPSPAAAPSAQATDIISPSGEQTAGKQLIEASTSTTSPKSELESLLKDIEGYQQEGHAAGETCRPDLCTFLSNNAQTGGSDQSHGEFRGIRDAAEKLRTEHALTNEKIQEVRRRLQAWKSHCMVAFMEQFKKQQEQIILPAAAPSAHAPGTTSTSSGQTAEKQAAETPASTPTPRKMLELLIKKLEEHEVLKTTEDVSIQAFNNNLYENARDGGQGAFNAEFRSIKKDAEKLMQDVTLTSEVVQALEKRLKTWHNHCYIAYMEQQQEKQKRNASPAAIK